MMKSSMTDQLLREAVARIIDPSSWAVMDGYLADVKRIKNAGYDPDSFKDKRSLTKADAIIALLKGSAVSQSGSAEDAPSGSEPSGPIQSDSAEGL